jgi:hypothetical protein
MAALAMSDCSGRTIPSVFTIETGYLLDDDGQAILLDTRSRP